MHNKVNYSDLIELGFKKIECSDDFVHIKKYGYPYFYLLYGDEDVNQVTMEWCPIEQDVNLYLNGNTYQKGLSLEEVKRIVEMLECQD